MAYIDTYRRERIAEVQRVARMHYEPGRQDRCWAWVWRCHIEPKFHISHRTFQSYMKVDLSEQDGCMNK